MNNDQRDDNTKVGLQQRIGPVVATGRGLVAKVARLNGRQVRGISLLAALGFTALTLLLALFGAASWWLPLLGVLAVAGLVVWLRREALAAARAREAARPTRAPRRVVRVDSVASAAVATGTESDTDTGSEKITAKANEVYGFEAPADTAAPTASVADQVVTADAAGPLEDTDGWAPTAVPRPTYAMKERAPQTEVAPAATVAAQPVSVDDLPFDGLALDEDLEELPAVYRAG